MKEPINLEAQDLSTLQKFRFRVAQTPVITARVLFPDRPKGYVAATRWLGGYATRKAMAMNYRARGNIAGAIRHERICDQIYDKLPDYAKW